MMSIFVMIIDNPMIHAVDFLQTEIVMKIVRVRARDSELTFRVDPRDSELRFPVEISS